MLQKEVEAIFGVSKSSLKEWIADSTNKKHDLGIFLSSLDAQAVKMMLSLIKKNECKKISLEELKGMIKS